MKQIVLAAMVMMTMAGSVSANATGWDYFWGTTVSQALDPKINGWDDFWGQCQDPNKTAAECAGVVATGTIAAFVLPLVAAGAVVVGVSMIPLGSTALLPVITTNSSFAYVAGVG